MNKEEHLALLRRIRVNIERAAAERDAAIRSAHQWRDGDAKISLREIGGAIGLSATGVQKIVNETRIQDAI